LKNVCFNLFLYLLIQKEVISFGIYFKYTSTEASYFLWRLFQIYWYKNRVFPLALILFLYIGTKGSYFLWRLFYIYRYRSKPFPLAFTLNISIQKQAISSGAYFKYIGTKASHFLWRLF